MLREREIRYDLFEEKDDDLFIYRAGVEVSAYQCQVQNLNSRESTSGSN